MFHLSLTCAVTLSPLGQLNQQDNHQVTMAAAMDTTILPVINSHLIMLEEITFDLCFHLIGE